MKRLRNIGRLFTGTPAGVIERAAVIIDGEEIAWCGKSGDEPGALMESVTAEHDNLVQPGMGDRGHKGRSRFPIAEHDVAGGGQVRRQLLRRAGQRRRNVTFIDYGFVAVGSAAAYMGVQIVASGQSLRLGP